MKPAEFAKHLRRVERKIEDAKDELDTLKEQFAALEAAGPVPPATPAAPPKEESDGW